MQPCALITGITGQVGSYLAEYLLDLGYKVHGLIRRVGMQDQRQRLERIAHLLDQVELHPGSLESYPSLSTLFSRVRFEECYQGVFPFFRSRCGMRGEPELKAQRS